MGAAVGAGVGSLVGLRDGLVVGRCIYAQIEGLVDRHVHKKNLSGRMLLSIERVDREREHGIRYANVHIHTLDGRRVGEGVGNAVGLGVGNSVGSALAIYNIHMNG